MSHLAESSWADDLSRGDLTANKRLACQSCQRRKIKCDRDEPCSQCRKNDRQCIPVVNQRLPRGLAGGRKKKAADLSKRVEALEGLLKNLQRPNSPQVALQKATDSTRRSSVDETATSSQYQYLGSGFWNSLQEELSKLGNELNNDDLADGSIDNLAEDAQTPLDGSNEDSPPRFDPVFGMVSSSILLQHPLPMLKVHLCEIFFRNVDPVFKVLHAPSVRAHIEHNHPYLDYSDGHSAVVALVFVIYYAAVSTMSEDECASTLWQPKRQALQQFRVMAEAALVQADYIVSTDVTTLQAFVIYLAVLRHDDRSRRTWTMVALAVRIALAMGLQNDDANRRPFDTEQRRRLWHALCVLDLQLAVDLASDRLIILGKSELPLPSNIHDTDIAFGQDQPIVPRVGWTEMSFILMSQEISTEGNRSHFTNPALKEERYEIAQALERNLEAQYLTHCDMQVPLQAFAAAATRSTVAAVKLHSLRGTNIAPVKAAPSPVKASVPISSEDILSIAFDALSLSQECVEDRLMEGWRWVLWTQWHGIAVAFASLSFITRGELADRAWTVTEAAYQHLIATVATGQQAQMCRPLEKLAQRARKARAAATLPVPLQISSADQATAADLNGFDGLHDFMSVFPDMGDWGFMDDALMPFSDQPME